MSARHITSTGRGPVSGPVIWRERVPETVRFKYRAFLSYSHPDTRSTDMTGLQAELEAAFRKLPIAPPDDGRIPYEWVIPGIGRQLALMKPVDCKVASPDAAKRKLGALKKHAKTRAQGSRCDGTRPQREGEEPVRQHRQNCEIGSSKRPSLHSGADQLSRYGNAEVRQC